MFKPKTFVVKTLFYLAASLFYSSASNAGTFTPAAGTTVTETPLIVSWNSTDPQQWVRAFDPSGTRIFDSGRQTSASGQVQIDIPETIGSVRIIFYEKVSGTWTPQERTYSVNLNGGGGGGGGVIVSDRFSCVDNTVDPFLLSDGITIFEDQPAMRCTLNCPVGEFLIAVQCNITTNSSIDTLGTRNSWAGTIEYQDTSSADCSLYGDYGRYLNLSAEPIDPLSVALIDLTASGSCMSLPQ